MEGKRVMSGMGTKDNSSSIPAPTSNPKHSSHSQLRFPLLIALFLCALRTCVCVCWEVVPPPPLPPPFHSPIIHLGEGSPPPPTPSPSPWMAYKHCSPTSQRARTDPRGAQIKTFLFFSFFSRTPAFHYARLVSGGGGVEGLVWVCSTEAGLAQR